MSIATVANLKGFVEPKCIIDYIKKYIDPNVINDINWEIICPLSEIKYTVNNQLLAIFPKSPEDMVNWRILSGSVHFNIFDKNQYLFYYYSPLQFRDGYEDCDDKDILEMINSETTSLHMQYCKESINILTTLIKYFGGGWLDENYSDNKDFYKIN